MIHLTTVELMTMATNIAMVLMCFLQCQKSLKSNQGLFVIIFAVLMIANIFSALNFLNV